MILTMQILWLAFCSTMGAITFMCFQLHGAFLTVQIPRPELYVFGVMALAAFVMSFMLPHLLLRLTRKQRQGLSPDAQLRAYFVPFILRIALLESVVLMGFLLSMISRENRVLPFAITAFLGLVFIFPTQDRVASITDVRFE
jgi:hypothetical protein